ncbi:MAG: hypothetical protein RLO81_09680 [Fulvivirga sp.]|uniref:hypothetical protein n=1 Tax=Fulvivirga sp. TaxID=1931237 RepID=UPI0032EB7205
MLDDIAKYLASKGYLDWAKFLVIKAPIFIIIVSYIFWLLSDARFEDLGSIGDFIGGILGSIWSLAGVLFLYHALMLQEKQQAQMNEERFDTIFFSALQSLEIAKQKFRFNDKVGVEGFKEFFLAIESLSMSNNEDNNEIKEKLFKRYTPENNPLFLGSIYSIWKMIDDSKVSNRQDYKSLFIANFTSHERIYIYNSIKSSAGNNYNEIQQALIERLKPQKEFQKF